MYLPSAFTRAGLAEIRSHVTPGDRIEIGPEDGCHLAANAVCIGKTLIMSGVGERLCAEVETRGYRVVKTPLPSFLRSGGSAFCLTLRLDRQTEAIVGAMGPPGSQILTAIGDTVNTTARLETLTKDYVV
jgi:hypothetical protein